jgi:hypothetical protein
MWTEPGCLRPKAVQDLESFDKVETCIEIKENMALDENEE